MACFAAGTLAFFLLCGAEACAHAARPAEPLIPLEVVGVGAVELYGPGLVGTTDSGSAVTFALTASGSAVLVRVWPGWRLEQLYPLRPKDSTYFQTGLHTVHVPAPVDLTPLLRPQPAARGPELSAAEQLQVEQCVWQEVRRRQSPPPRAASDTSRRTPPAPPPTQIPFDYAGIEQRCTRAVSQHISPAPAARTEATPVGHYLVLVVSDHAQDARHLQMRLGAVDITESSLASVLQVLPGFLAGADAKTWAGYVAQVQTR
jgi:hypothetical protein